MQLAHPIFKILSEIAVEKGLEIYVIGGYVRDLILRRPSKDIDIVVLGSGIELAETAAKQLGFNGFRVQKLWNCHVPL